MKRPDKVQVKKGKHTMKKYTQRYHHSAYNVKVSMLYGERLPAASAATSAHSGQSPPSDLVPQVSMCS